MGDYYNSSNVRQSRNPPDYYEQQRRIHNRQQPTAQSSQSTHQQQRGPEDESVVYVYDEEETYGRRNEEAVYVYDEGEYGDTDMRQASGPLVTIEEQLEAQAMLEQHGDYGQQQQMDMPPEPRSRSKERRRSRSSSRSRRRSRTRSRSRSRSRGRRRSRSRSGSRSRRRRHKRSYSRSYSRSRSRSRSRSPRRRRRSSRSSEERDNRHFRYPRYQAEPHYTIAVKGLPIDCDENTIFTLIQQEGFQPKDVRILRKKDTGQSRGFGFIEFPDVASASAWMDHTQGYLIVDDRHHAELQYSVDKPGWNAPQPSCSGGPMQKFGDWICAKCTMNNFKKRDQCFKCGLPRNESDSMQERGFSEIGITPCDTLLFRDLPDQCDEQKVTESLKKVTALEPLCVSMGESKMFAYVQMRNVNEATQLLTTLTQMTCLRIDGCEVIVSYSKLPLTAILTGQTLTQTAEQINRMQRQFSQHPSQSMTNLNQSQTDAANAAAAVAQNALRKAHVMRHVTNEVLANQLEAMQAAQLVAAGLVAQPTQLLVHAQQRMLATKAAVEASTLQLGTVHTPFGELPRYPNPDTSLYQFEPKSGYYFDPSTGLYYDGNSRYYLNAETQKWLYWDSRYQTFLPCQQGQQAAADGSGSAQPPPPQAAVGEQVVAAAAASSAEALPAEGVDGEGTKKETDKTEKAKSAKKIAQEMERWAKEQAKKKSTTGKAAGVASDANRPAGNSTDKPAAPSFSIRTGAADTAFNILERTKGGLLPFNDDSDGEDPPVATSSSSAQRTATSGQRPSESDDDIVDYSKLACLLCRRQFPSRDVLDKHVQLSNLHKQNLEARRGSSSASREEPSKVQHQPAGVDSLEAALAFASNASASSSASSSLQYRDRAKERRQKYGQDKKLLSDLEAPSDDLKQKYLSSRAVEDAEMALTVPLDSSNKGSKLLRSMGWSEGQGLGRNNQGIVDPIMADRRVQGAGLGAVGSKVKTAPNATYKESVKAALRDRYYELE
uniref:RNA-binding protein 5 n=1 Tax=Plectus sambesii TaxID=2011161 RepID=A0A914WZ79_9BILA